MRSKDIFEDFFNSYSGNILSLPHELCWKLSSSIYGEKSVFAWFVANILSFFVYMFIIYFMFCFFNGLIECIKRLLNSSDKKRELRFKQARKDFINNYVERRCSEYIHGNGVLLDINDKKAMAHFYESLNKGIIIGIDDI